jgi:phosphohistidine phosphatase SixA
MMPIRTGGVGSAAAKHTDAKKAAAANARDGQRPLTDNGAVRVMKRLLRGISNSLDMISRTL